VRKSYLIYLRELQIKLLPRTIRLSHLQRIRV